MLGGAHHLAISVPGTQWYAIKSRLDERGYDYMVESNVSIYTRDPDGARIEFIQDPLGEMYGEDTL